MYKKRKVSLGAMKYFNFLLGLLVFHQDLYSLPRIGFKNKIDNIMINMEIVTMKILIQFN